MAIDINFIRKSFLPLKLPTACLQEKSSQKKNLAYLTDFLVEETFLPIANITGWTFTGLQTVGFLFVNICSKLSTINEYFQTPTFSINEHCSRLSLKCHLPQYHQVIPHQWQLFLQGCLFLTWKRDSIWKKSENST